MEKVKVLITGPVNNDFKSFTSKLSTLQKSKAGPFDVCFCVGPFFGTGNDSYQEATDFLSQGAPLPVYFCDVGVLPNGIELPPYEAEINDEAEISLDDENDNDKATKDSANEDLSPPKGIVKIAHNVYHLRGMSYQSSPTADILDINVENSKKNYLTVAFLPPKTRMGSPQTSNFESNAKHPSFVGCDILLTSEWGQGMAGSSCLSNQDKTNLQQSYDVNFDLNEIGSFDVAEFASLCRPRYHFAPSASAIHNGQTDEGYESSFFLQSIPYKNPPSALSSGVMKNYHTSRFLALCQVVDANKAKEGGKTKKFIHALGIQPLWSMDRITATAIPENTVVVSSPYTDEGYVKDSGHASMGSSNVNGSGAPNVGLSEAQTRRLLSEENTSDQYRWNIQNRKRNHVDSSSQEVDPTNCTLFLYGLQKDVSRGANLNRGVIFKAFQAHGCTRVRYSNNDNETDRNGRPHNFCFLDFPTHAQASDCLSKMGGMAEISGINLSLNWSSGNNSTTNKRMRPNVPPPPPVGFQGIMMPGDAIDQSGQKRQRNGLTEAEAMDSSSVFIHLKPARSADQCSTAISNLGDLAQAKLEDAINGDGAERVTAEDEPALKVTFRILATKPHCGFLNFASHAAASMALAILTGSTDGGSLLDEFIKDQELFQDAQLWWGKQSTAHESTGQDNVHNFQKHHFPLDARTDCWFCLASPTCEKHLIVNLFNNCYVTMPKGPVNKNHTLIVPINHSSSENDDNTKRAQIIGAFLDPNPAVVAEIEDTKMKIREHATAVLDKDLYVFERAIPTKMGYHSHVNCIPIERGLGSKIRGTMLSMAAAPSKYGGGFELIEIQNPEISVNTILKNSDELDGYFYAEIPMGGSDDIKRFLYKYNSKDCEKKKFVPLQFGREVLASVLGDPKLASWKECMLPKEEEEAFTTEYRESFEP